MALQEAYPAAGLLHHATHSVRRFKIIHVNQKNRHRGYHAGNKDSFIVLNQDEVKAITI